MTDFNSLPLAEQLKALQEGDEFITDNGSRVLFGVWTDAVYCIVRVTQEARARLHRDEIRRVIRPSARKVPEVAGILRAYATEISCEDSLTQVFLALADHFEREAKP